MKHRIKFIWFDIGYTLLKLKREETFIKLTARMGIPLKEEKVEEAFHCTDKLFMREYPGILGGDRHTYMPWYFGNLFYKLGIKVDICSFFASWKKVLRSPLEAWVPCPNTIPVLERLKSAGYRMGVISNWDKSARSILKKHGIDRFFEVIVISSEVGYEKPSPEIFRIALEKAGVSPGESLYVGDNYYDDAVGAGKAGIETVILNRFGRKGIEEITDCTILNDISELEEYVESIF